TIARAVDLRPASVVTSWRLLLLDSCARLMERLPLLRFSRILFHQVDRLFWHDGRYGVLVNQLRVPIAPQEHAEIIKPCHDPLKLHAIYEEDRQRGFVLADVVEEGVLEAL